MRSATDLRCRVEIDYFKVEDLKMRQLATYAFTFGSNHTTEDGRSLGRCYCIVSPYGIKTARERMEFTRGSKWSMQYLLKDFLADKQSERYGLVEISIDDIGLTQK